MVTKTEVALRDWIIVVTGLPFLFVGGVETWDFGLQKLLGTVSRAQWAIQVGTWETAER